MRHAVLCYADGIMPNTMIMWIDGNGWHKEQLPDPCYTLYDLARVTYPRFITHLWVMPSYGEFEPAKSNQEWGLSPYCNRKGKMMGCSVFQRGHRHKDFDIIFPQHTSWWGTDAEKGWMQEADPHELLTTLHYLEKVLGITITASPGRTGWSYLKKLHPEWVEEIPDFDMKAHHFDNKATGDIIWEREFDPLEWMETSYLHKFDQAASYPYAGTRTRIGVGVPEHKDHGRDADPMNDKQSVGVWRCTIAYCSLDYNPLLPPVWKEDKGMHAATEGWLAGPIIRLLRKAGHTVQAHEGYVFPEKHEVLASWGKGLWQARIGYELPLWRNTSCAKFAQRATKQIANSTIGMTAFRGFEDDDEMKRPDIRMQVIARHRELLWHNLNKIRAIYNTTPIMVYMDAMYYAGSSPDGRAFLPELVKREGQFGGYKYEGCIKLTPDVRAMFSQSLNIAERLEFLNRKGWTK